ncbi:MAG: ferric reductase-like transmembrane domain-containing protein [Methylophilus sp.]|nr:ferric reductase-like transmembrane domain-containing protein [Methylophilus sp.]
MKVIQISLIGIIALMTMLWMSANTNALVNTHEIFAWRSLLLQYSGILALTVMSLGMLLTMRFSWLEDRLNGLDKVYRLHKWLGITALVFVLSHWLLFKVPRWLVEAGLLIKPARVARPPESVEIFNFFQSQRGIAEEIGEYAFYLFVALIAIALIKRFPYRYFFMTHRWIALVYLAVIVHAVVLMKYSYWTTILGLVLIPLMLLGIFATFTSMFKRIGQSRKVVGEVTAISFLDGVNMTSTAIQLKSQWTGHYAGQFAFVTFDQHEGAHPFSITSAWLGDGKLTFLIKALGDYTNTLNTSLKVGQSAVIEGPYGRFDFESKSQRQIWIAGGVGITPFIARMKSLAIHPDGRLIDLFYSTTDVDHSALLLLEKDTKAAGVKLHLTINSRDGYLNGEMLRIKIPDWKGADIWFCGPAKFGQTMRSDLMLNGMVENHFHQELFEMR